jgi:4-oxalocrotonate tautomerase
MPHVIVKLYPGKSEQQKTELAEAITASVMNILGHGADAVSVGFEEVSPADWPEQVYRRDIVSKPGSTYKQPGYKM